jgi:hypothetical protein
VTRALLLALALAAAPDAGVKPKPPLLATLQRTGCYGTCPTYLVTVDADGLVEWEGKKFVQSKGRRTAQLSPADLAALKQAFADAKYTTLSGNFACYEMTDNPHAVTSYVDGQRTITIDHYYGCRSTPGVNTLTALEDRFDKVVNTAQWIGPRDAY